MKIQLCSGGVFAAVFMGSKCLITYVTMQEWFSHIGNFKEIIFKLSTQF